MRYTRLLERIDGCTRIAAGDIQESERLDGLIDLTSTRALLRISVP